MSFGVPASCAITARTSSAREDDRETTRTARAHQVVEPWQLHTNDFPIQEEERCQGLVLGRSTDLGLDGERGQKAGGLGGAQLARVTLAVKQDVAADPADVEGPGWHRSFPWTIPEPARNALAPRSPAGTSRTRRST